MKHRDLYRALELNKAVLRQFLGAMTEAEIQRRMKDYWTIYEHLAHLAETQALMAMRIGKFLQEEAPIMVPFTPEKNPEAKSKPPTTSELIDEFCQQRDLQLKLLKQAKPRDWDKAGTHGEYTKYSLEILVCHTVLHDSFHMARMEQLWIMKEEFVMELDSN